MARNLFPLAIIAAALALIAPDRAAEAQASDPSRASTILVFDVSNSMWGQIDGVSKIEIAREVIGDLLTDWDPAVNLGLVAYGHRREGDCGDIENVIPVGPVDAASFSRSVNSLVPRGKTPLTDAVRVAAGILNYTDSPATIILVSDGIESCNADPCSLAEELERGGVAFTAHVIGFDVGRIEDQRQLSCLADMTGGRYLTADNASELSAALRTVAAPPPPMLRLEAADSADGPALADPRIVWTVVSLGAEETIFGGEAMAAPEFEAKSGRYFARAELDGRVGSIEFDYEAGADALQRVVLKVSVTLDGPEFVEVGTPLSVGWTGPDAPGDFIALAREGAAATDIAAYARTSGGSPAVMTAPDAPGPHEIRYVDATGAVLASIPVDVIAPAATLEAPPTVEAGAEFPVQWSGPDANGDYLSIVAAGAPDGEAGNYAYTRDGSPLTLRAPDKEGPHEIRYVSAQTRSVIGRLPIAVVPVPATLEAAPTVVAGAEIEVTWTGPDNQNDFIGVAPAGAEAGAYGAYAYTREGSPLKVRAPDQPGTYELRYLTGQTRATLATLPITVTAPAASLEAAPTIGAGDEISVTWTGPDNQNDFITIVPAGAEAGTFDNYAYTREGSPLKLRAPDAAGAYELRYLTGQTRATLATLPIAVTAASASLEAPPTIGAGDEIKVAWTGPDSQNDFITIVPVGTEEGKFGTYSYTRQGSPLTVRAPDQPGAYELRYLTGQTRATLATLPIAVTAAAASLEAPPTVSAGAEIKVAWEGPDSRNDFITIVPVGTEEGKFGTYSYTRQGSPVGVRAPDEPGAYELRYLTGQTRATLATLPIAVTGVAASLEAAPTVAAGAELSVTWTGPDNQNDFLAIVPAGAEEKTTGNYSYTREGSPLKVLAPDEPGAYELRYVSGQSRATIASVPLTITDVTATLEAAPVANAGARIKVEWTGPDNRNDYIGLFPADEADGGGARLYAYTREGSPLDVPSFETPGAYELRYVMSKSRRVLARLPVTLNPVSATLEAAPVAKAGEAISVTWTGPDNQNDLIAVAKIDAEGKQMETYAYTRNGSPLQVKAPKAQGAYELRYLTSRDKNVLARLPITVN